MTTSGARSTLPWPSARRPPRTAAPPSTPWPTRCSTKPLYAGCRNEYLAEQIRVARRLIQRYRFKDFQSKAQITKSLEDHRKIARAIQAGDEVLAAETMLLHVPAGTTGFSEFLAKVPMSFFETDSGPDA